MNKPTVLSAIDELIGCHKSQVMDVLLTYFQEDSISGNLPGDIEITTSEWEIGLSFDLNSDNIVEYVSHDIEPKGGFYETGSN